MASTNTVCSISVSLALFSLLLWGASTAVEPFACDPNNGGNFPFCQVKLPIQSRVKDLIGRLTLQEKVKLLINNAGAVPRLGIQGNEWWSEALHGVSDVGPGTKFGGAFPGATSSPEVIATAASFIASLWEAMGQKGKFLAVPLFGSQANGSTAVDAPHRRREKRASDTDIEQTVLADAILVLLSCFQRMKNGYVPHI